MDFVRSIRFPEKELDTAKQVEAIAQKKGQSWNRAAIDLIKRGLKR